MAKAPRAKSTRKRSAPRTTDAAVALIDREHRRFPWPAHPQQRYSVESPYLAVVNARGPWAVWRHRKANPPFIPLCLDLLNKPFWREAGNDQRNFAVTVWLAAAREDDWGIVWGDPVRLCHQWGLDPATFTARLEWMIERGLACYLTVAEAEATKSWRPPQRKTSRGRGGIKGGEEQDKGSTRQGKASKAREGTGAQADSQDSSVSARTMQIPDPKTSKTKQGKQGRSKPIRPKAQIEPKAQESVNLPKSDPGAAAGSARTSGGVTDHRPHQRPRSVRRSEARRIGEITGWCNPRAVEFGRAMYAAIHGQEAPPDLMAAHDRDKADVGVWVHYWAMQVEPALSANCWGEFQERCVRDVTKKRKLRSIRDLGRVAMGRKSKPGIVPGILAAMQAEIASCKIVSKQELTTIDDSHNA